MARKSTLLIPTVSRRERLRATGCGLPVLARTVKRGAVVAVKAEFEAALVAASQIDTEQREWQGRRWAAAEAARVYVRSKSQLMSFVHPFHLYTISDPKTYHDHAEDREGGNDENCILSTSSHLL